VRAHEAELEVEVFLPEEAHEVPIAPEEIQEHHGQVQGKAEDFDVEREHKIINGVQKHGNEKSRHDHVVVVHLGTFEVKDTLQKIENGMLMALLHFLDLEHRGGKKRHAVVVAQHSRAQHMHHGDDGDAEKHEGEKSAHAQAPPLADEVEDIFKKGESQGAHDGEFDHVVDGLEKAAADEAHDPEFEEFFHHAHAQKDDEGLEQGVHDQGFDVTAEVDQTDLKKNEVHRGVPIALISNDELGREDSAQEREEYEPFVFVMLPQKNRQPNERWNNGDEKNDNLNQGMAQMRLEVMEWAPRLWDRAKHALSIL